MQSLVLCLKISISLMSSREETEAGRVCTCLCSNGVGKDSQQHCVCNCASRYPRNASAREPHTLMQHRIIGYAGGFARHNTDLFIPRTHLFFDANRLLSVSLPSLLSSWDVPQTWSLLNSQAHLEVPKILFVSCMISTGAGTIANFASAGSLYVMLHISAVVIDNEWPSLDIVISLSQLLRHQRLVATPPPITSFIVPSFLSSY